MARLLSMLISAVRLKCPRCGAGSLYAKPFRMRSHCANCGIKFEREQGYFVGAIYINYAATTAIAVPGFFVLDLFMKLPIDQQLWIWVPFAIAFPVLFFHHSRAFWLVLDHLFNPPSNLYGVPTKKSDTPSNSKD
jgi:uncharacterized protein (DUF983 family)